MMESEKIQAIMKMYQETKSHEVVMTTFGLNAAQEYAINIFGRDNDLSPEMLADKIEAVSSEMSIGQVAVVLGFSAETSIKNKAGVK